MKRPLFRLLLTILTAANAQAQISYSGGVYSQTFNALAGTTNNQTGLSWTDNTTLPGWYASKTTYNVTDGTLNGSAANFDSTSTATNVGLFSFGAAGSSDRALGSRTTSNAVGNPTINYGVKLVNTSGQTLTQFSVLYTGEQWFKSSAATAHALNVEYQLGATDLSSGVWTGAAALTFTAPIATGTTPIALDGNLAANRSLRVARVSGISWAPNQALWIRINDDNESGAEQGLAIDDFNFWAGTDSALYFNGSSSYVTMGEATATLGASQFTIECRFMRTGTGVTTSTGTGGVANAIPLVTKGRSQGDTGNINCNYFLGIDSATNTLCADFESIAATGISDGQNYPVFGSTVIQNNIWYHAAATYNGTTWRLYLNGVQDATNTPTAGASPWANSIQHFGIGTALDSGGAASGFFQGAIDEVRVWNVARAATSILADKDTQIDTPTAGLLARYGLAEGAGTVTASSISGAPNGTFPGTTLPLWISGVPFTNVIIPTGSGILTRGPYLQKAAPTQMTVRWRSSLSIAGWVRFGTDSANLTQTADEATPGLDHVVTLTGLNAGTTYFYSVGSATDTLASGSDFTFTTPPLAGSAVNTRLWVLGDAGTGNASQRAVRDAFYSWTGTRTPDMILQLGDNAYNTGLDSEFQTAVFDTYSSMLRKSPLWSCLGNHETAQATDFNGIYPYFDIYTFPTAGECGGVASGTEHYFSFNYGNIHFISLDSMTASRSASGAMATWLTQDLAATTATWIICFFHHPPYTKGSHNSDTEIELIEMRQNILPILEAGGVDLVLSGHSHCYERSFLLDKHYGLSTSLTAAMKVDDGDGRPAGTGAYLKPLTGPRDNFGAVYVVSGSAGQISASGLLDHPAHFISLRNLGSLVLDINGTRLDATFLRETTAPTVALDTFTILKQGAADTDGDGIPDDFEIAYGLDRKSAADATFDIDNDGFTALQEYFAGTNPHLASSLPSLGFPQTAGADIKLSFPTVSGRRYQVQYSDTLAAGSWLPLGLELTGTGSPLVQTDAGAAAVTKRFYRLQIRP